MKRIVINVTPEDIQQGLSNSETQCPIAICLGYQLGARWVRITPETLSWSDVTTRMRHIHRTPPEVAEFIGRCDRGQIVKPFSFILNSKTWIDTKPMKPLRMKDKGVNKSKPTRKSNRKKVAHSRSGNPWAESA